MKLATLNTGDPDGRLLVVSRDLGVAVDAGQIAPSMLRALERWDEVAPQLQALSDQVNASQHPSVFPFDPAACAAPFPRCYQWCDASAFLNHGKLMERACNTPPIPDFGTIPVMYRGASDNFLGLCADVPPPDETPGIGFEGEFGVVFGCVPMGVSPAAALSYVRLLVQVNDWSLRAPGPCEMKSGFGFLQTKPSTSFAPVAITPDELGEGWRDGRVHLERGLQCVHFGAAHDRASGHGGGTHAFYAFW